MSGAEFIAATNIIATFIITLIMEYKKSKEEYKKSRNSIIVKPESIKTKPLQSPTDLGLYDDLHKSDYDKYNKINEESTRDWRK